MDTARKTNLINAVGEETAERLIKESDALVDTLASDLMSLLTQFVLNVKDVQHASIDALNCNNETKTEVSRLLCGGVIDELSMLLTEKAVYTSIIGMQKMSFFIGTAASIWEMLAVKRLYEDVSNIQMEAVLRSRPEMPKDKMS
jgi:hypothetical protein